VPPECQQGRFVDRLQTAILALDPDAQVGDGVEMEPGNLVVVPGPEEPPLVLSEKVPKGARSDGRQSEDRMGIVDTHVFPPWGRQDLLPLGKKLSAEPRLLRAPENG
jgi:hypothetical protein